MKKFKIGIGFWLLVLSCLFMQTFMLLLNYILALVLHELAHLYVAVKRGYSLKHFKVGMFGVAVELDENINQEDMFSINIAGPMCNFFICICCLALYQLFPITYVYLKDFCASNLILAVFNLLPVYPLDGGKIFKSLIKNNKIHRVLDSVIRYALCFIFLVLFAWSGITKFNWFYLLMACFFLIAKEKTSSFSLFKYKDKQKLEKVEILKVDEDLNLYELLKKINRNKYTIFFCKSTKFKYIDEDTLIDLATKKPLTMKIKQIED